MAYIDAEAHNLLEVRYTITKTALLDASYEEWTADQLAKAVAEVVWDYSRGDVDKAGFFKWEFNGCYLKYRLHHSSEILTYIQILRVLPKRRPPRNFSDVIAVGKEITMEVIKVKIGQYLET